MRSGPYSIPVLVGTTRLGTPHGCASAGRAGKRRVCRGILPELAGSHGRDLGERFFRSISPFLQGISMMLLVTILLLFPVSSQFLKVLINTSAARYFPPVLVSGNI